MFSCSILPVLLTRWLFDRQPVCRLFDRSKRKIAVAT